INLTGTLLFCPECGTLLSLPQDDNSTYVECEQCKYREPASSYENLEVTTISTLESIPSPLRLKRTTRTRAHVGGESNEECPKCGHRESTYKEKQMRSADEGATLIYSVGFVPPNTLCRLDAYVPLHSSA
ncbi:DNA-directed RNA polymerase, partial [Calocera viscosa TUFC12733]